MKVKQLIAQLKKLPQDANVIWQDHDQTEDEAAGEVGYATLSDSEVLKEQYGEVVVLHS